MTNDELVDQMYEEQILPRLQKRLDFLQYVCDHWHGKYAPPRKRLIKVYGAFCHGKEKLEENGSFTMKIIRLGKDDLDFGIQSRNEWVEVPNVPRRFFGG